MFTHNANHTNHLGLKKRQDMQAIHLISNLNYRIYGTFTFLLVVAMNLIISVNWGLMQSFTTLGQVKTPLWPLLMALFPSPPPP